MGLRPGKCYRSLDKRPYTRLAVSVHRRNYVGSAPGLRTRQFNMGNSIRNFSHVVDLMSNDAVIMRDNALESIRQAINRRLVKALGKDAFFMKIRVYPHDLLREHKMAQGAGADRVSSGMSLSFGKVIGRGVRLRKGKVILSILVNEKDVGTVVDSISVAKSRLYGDIAIKIHTDVESIGTKPAKTRAALESEKAEKEASSAEAKDDKTKDAKGKDAKGKDAKGKDDKAKSGKDDKSKDAKPKGKK